MSSQSDEGSSGPGPHQLNLLSLGSDIVLLILSILYHDNAPELLNLTVLCRFLRHHIFELIFRAVVWPKGVPDFYPSTLWPYIRSLTYELKGTSNSSHKRALKVLSDVLPGIPNVSTFVYSGNLAPSVTVVSTVAEISTRNLTSLRISTSFLVHDAVDTFSIFSGLQKLVIMQPERSTFHAAPEDKRSITFRCVSNLIWACQTSLDFLQLPGEFCPLETFASSPSIFPALKTFSLTGYPPIDADLYPIWTVVQCMPRLSRLEILCHLRIVGASANRYVLMPEDAIPPPGSFHLFPADLETLVLANPSLVDHIFKRLPHSLKRLELDFVPDWENMLSSSDSLAYHRPSELLQLFRDIEIFLGPEGFPGLKELCIKMGWCITPRLLRSICRLFPLLISLETQGIRYVQRGIEPESPMTECVESLSLLAHLRTLKLALELREDSYRYSPTGNPNVGSISESVEIWAKTLALCLPTLERIAFEIRPHTGRVLGPKVLVGSPVWVWFQSVEGAPVESRMQRVQQEVKWEYHKIRGLSKSSVFMSPTLLEELVEGYGV